MTDLVATKPIDDRIAWAMVAVPVVGTFIELMIHHDLTIAIVIINIGLGIADAVRLASDEHPAPDGPWVLFVPGYLWRRSRLLKRSPILAIAWCIAFAASFIAGMWSDRSRVADAACATVSQIIQEQLAGSAKCRRVTISDNAGDGFYIGNALLDNGRELRITLEDKGADILVQIAPQ
jgi:hypothetical protein